MTYMEHLQDNIRTYSPLVPLTEEETQYLYDTADLMMEYPHHTLQRLQVLHALPRMELTFLPS